MPISWCRTPSILPYLYSMGKPTFNLLLPVFESWLTEVGEIRPNWKFIGS